MQSQVSSLFDALVSTSDPTAALGLRDRISCLGDPVAAHCRAVLRAPEARSREVVEAIRLLAPFESQSDLRLIARYLLLREIEVRRAAAIAMAAHFDPRPVADAVADVLLAESDLANQILMVRLLAATRLQKHQRTLDRLEKRAQKEHLAALTPYGKLDDAIARARQELSDGE